MKHISGQRLQHEFKQQTHPQLYPLCAWGREIGKMYPPWLKRSVRASAAIRCRAGRVVATPSLRPCLRSIWTVPAASHRFVPAPGPALRGSSLIIGEAPPSPTPKKISGGSRIGAGSAGSWAGGERDGWQARYLSGLPGDGGSGSAGKREGANVLSEWTGWDDGAELQRPPGKHGRQRDHEAGATVRGAGGEPARVEALG